MPIQLDLCDYHLHQLRQLDLLGHGTGIQSGLRGTVEQLGVEIEVFGLLKEIGLIREPFQKYIVKIGKNILLWLNFILL